MRTPRQFLQISVAAVGLIVLSAAANELPARPLPGRVAIVLGDHGLNELTYGGVPVLQNGVFSVKNVVLQKPDGTTVTGSVLPSKTSMDKAAQHLVMSYAWGRVACVYQARDNRLTLDVEISNTTGDQTITEIELEPVVLVFPNKLKDHDGSNTISRDNGGEPGIILVRDDGALGMAFCNEDVAQPLEIAIPAATDRPRNRTFPITVKTNARDPRRWPVIDRPIHAQGADRFALSLRFGGTNATPTTLANDIITRFRHAYPYRLKWPDRRPIASLFLATSHSKMEENWPRNPRGWFLDPNLDVTTAEGRAVFRTRVLYYATNSVRILKDMNAQGFILSDVEGQEWPHACSYLGDPRSLPPEFEPIADEFFKKFTAAGLRAGVCIRPTRPLRPAYGDRVDQYEVGDALQNMIAKTAYAKKRWGCTIIYVDSNVDPVFLRPMDATIFRKLVEAHPDVLFIPEHQNTLYYAYTAPTDSYTHHGIVCTPQSVLDVYPEAFSAIYIPDRDMQPHWQAFVAAIRRGDILVFRGWFDDPVNQAVKRIYREAGRVSLITGN